MRDSFSTEKAKDSKSTEKAKDSKNAIREMPILAKNPCRAKKFGINDETGGLVHCDTPPACMMTDAMSGGALYAR
jgi:hypothetical protein